MKNYTDIEQSKQLTKILPLESADMVLLHEEPYETSDSKFDGLHQALCVPFSKYDKSWRQKYKNISYFPCWSLAALLEVLPKGTNVSTPQPLNELSYCCWNQQEEIFADNPVDACYDMIIHLHELKML